MLFGIPTLISFFAGLIFGSPAQADEITPSTSNTAVPRPADILDASSTTSTQTTETESEEEGDEPTDDAEDDLEDDTSEEDDLEDDDDDNEEDDDEDDVDDDDDDLEEADILIAGSQASETNDETPLVQPVTSSGLLVEPGAIIRVDLDALEDQGQGGNLDPGSLQVTDTTEPDLG